MAGLTDQMVKLENAQLAADSDTPKFTDLQEKIKNLTLPDVNVYFLKANKHDKNEEVKVEEMTLDKKAVVSVMTFIKEVNVRLNRLETLNVELKNRQNELIKLDFAERVDELEAFKCKSEVRIESLSKKQQQSEILHAAHMTSAAKETTQKLNELLNTFDMQELDGTEKRH